MAQELLRVVSNQTLDREEQSRAQMQQARQDQSIPFLLGISEYIRKCYDAAKWDRTKLDDRMLKSFRQRLGQYDPEMLAVLQEQGGNQVFMLLTQTKCRGAEAWMRDVLLSTGQVPWDMTPTPVPELSESDTKNIMMQIREQVEVVTKNQGLQLTEADIDQLKDLGMRKIKVMRSDEAKQACTGMKKLISDQLQQGNFMNTIDSFLSDLCTYPFAVVKGPIITRKPLLKWARDPETGEHKPVVEQALTPYFTRVSPFDFYWEPGIIDIQNGYTIERHELSRRDVVDMKQQPGYNKDAVELVLNDYADGMLNDWLDVQYNELERRRLESRRGSVQASMSPAPIFKALEFNGSVSGKMLVEWGHDEIDDIDAEYEVNAWLIGSHVVRAILNADPLHEKPYRVTTFNPVPNSIAGLSLPELIADTQAVANAAARAIVNNMAIASGPQVEVNLDRLPAGDKITQIYPWKIWQMLNDPLGTSSPGVRFNQPSDNSQSLMQIFEKFSRQADEQSGIPAYTYGDTDIQGAGRTASGLSMLMGSAGKGIRQIITGIDSKVIQPALRHVYRWNMEFSDDPSIKGDADVVMKGTSSLVKEQVNLRRNEFLQATANEYDMEVVGIKGRAAILREVAEGLEMDTDKIIPSEQELELQDKLNKQMELTQKLAEIQSKQQQPQQDQVSVQQQPDGGKKTTVKSTGMVNTQPGNKAPGNTQGYAQGGVVGQAGPVNVDVQGMQNAAAIDSNKIMEGKLDTLGKKLTAMLAKTHEQLERSVEDIQQDFKDFKEEEEEDNNESGGMAEVLKALKALQKEMKEVKKVKTVKVVRGTDGKIIGLKEDSK